MTPKNAKRGAMPMLCLTFLAVIALIGGGCSDSAAPDRNLDYGGGGDVVDGDSGPYTGTGVGMEAPDFTATDSMLQEHTLSDYRGQPVVLYFWASYCGYCLEQNDRFQAWVDTYGDDVVILSLNMGDSDTVINAYLAEHELTYPALMVLGGIQEQYRVYSVPHAFVLDAEGIVQFNGHPGYITDQMIIDLAAAQD